MPTHEVDIVIIHFCVVQFVENEVNKLELTINLYPTYTSSIGNNLRMKYTAQHIVKT
jgi:hypothetical protein